MTRLFKSLVTICLCWPVLVAAHSLNDSFFDLQLNEGAVSGSLQVAISDLEIAIGLDNNQDTQITWGEIRRASPAIAGYVNSRIELSRGDQVCTLSTNDLAIEQLSGGPYVTMGLIGQCAESGALSLDYGLLFDVDNSHRGIAAISVDGESATRLFSPANQSLTLDGGSLSFWTPLISFIGEGIWHIWIGIDHILFLLAMLLGVVLHTHRTRTTSTTIWTETGWSIVKMVTAFTLAHSITLILASLRIVELPAQLVETAIALSVVVSAVNILIPIFGRHHWPVAFAFGLVHGFGFANVLGDLNLATGQFVASLLGFNIGVEIGQLVIVLGLIPILALLIHWQWSRRLTTVLSALAIAQVGMLWFLDRGFGVTVL